MIAELVDGPAAGRTVAIEDHVAAYRISIQVDMTSYRDVIYRPKRTDGQVARNAAGYQIWACGE